LTRACGGLARACGRPGCDSGSSGPTDAARTEPRSGSPHRPEHAVLTPGAGEPMAGPCAVNAAVQVINRYRRNESVSCGRIRCEKRVRIVLDPPAADMPGGVPCDAAVAVGAVTR